MPFREESCRSSCIYSGPLHSYSRDAVSQHPSTRAGAESIQLIYSGCAVVVCGESQATEKLNAAFNVYKVAHDAEADNARPINQRPRAAAPSVSSSRSIGQGQAAPDGSSPAVQWPLGLLPSHSLMGQHKVPLLHQTTIFFVTVSLRRKITPFTIGMRVCNFLVTRGFPGSSLNFVISLLLRCCLWARIAQNSRVA